MWFKIILKEMEKLEIFLFLALLITFSVELQSEGQAEIIEIYRYENAIENWNHMMMQPH